MAFNSAENQALTDTGLTVFSQGPNSTDAFRKLFGGLGDALQNTTAAVDATLNEKIRMDADTAVSGVVKDTSAEFTKAGGDDFISGDPAFKDLSSLAKARAQGTISEVAFQTKVAAKTRELRAKYPAGYGSDIEARIAASLASSAEGRLLDAKLKAADTKMNDAATTASDEKKEIRALLNANMEIWTDPAVIGAYEKLTKRSFADDLKNEMLDPSSLRYVIALKKGQEHQEEMADKRIQWAGRAEAVDAQIMVGKIIRQEYNKEVSKPYFAFVEKLAQSQGKDSPGGSAITPEESQAIRDGFMGAASGLRLALLTELSQEKYAKIPKEQRDSMKSQVEDFIKLYDEALNNPDSGMLNRLANENRDLLLSDQNYVLKNYPEMRIYKLAKSLDVPDEAITKYLLHDPKVVDVMKDNLLSTVLRAGLYSPDEGFMDLIKKLDATDPEKAKLLKDTFTGYSDLLKDMDPKEIDFEKLVSLMFKNKNKDMLKSLNKEDRGSVFKMFVNPKVIENLKSDPEAMALFNDWATTQFSVIMKPYVDTIKDGDLNRYGMNITFDPTDNKFKYTARKATDEESRLSLFPRAFFEDHLEGSVADAIVQANDYIQSMLPMWEAQGISPEEGLNLMFGVNDLGKGKNPPMLKLLFDKMKEAAPPTIKDYRLDPKTGKLPYEGSLETPSKDSSVKPVSFSPESAVDIKDVEASDAFLKRVLNSDKPESYISGLDDNFSVSLAQMLQSAPPEIKKGLGVLSGARSVKRQSELWDAALKKYGSVAAARKWVAPPGHSMHNHGKAVDLAWNGKRLDEAPGYVIKWVHQNADKFGLSLPLSNENWHIEPKGARKKKKTQVASS